MRKKIEWKNPNKMLAESGCKTWDSQILCLSPGNVIDPGMFGWFIRPWQETECNGFTNPPGHLFNYDIKGFRSRIPDPVMVVLRKQTESTILYKLRHTRKNREVIHGWILTTKDYKFIGWWRDLNSPKGWDVLTYALAYLCDDWEDKQHLSGTLPDEV